MAWKCGFAARRGGLRVPVSVRRALWWLTACALASAGAVGFAQEQQALCDGGEGQFDARLHDGAGVTVGPVTNQHGFAGRTCSASLKWKGATVLEVGTAGQIDLDAMGADLGFEVPVAAFEIRQAANDWRATYAIYSLDKAPRLLAKLTGGDFYQAGDVDFSGRIAIITGG
jgi:hypothetical protein